MLRHIFVSINFVKLGNKQPVQPVDFGDAYRRPD
jgi:hypothetical protein